MSDSTSRFISELKEHLDDQATVRAVGTDELAETDADMVVLVMDAGNEVHALEAAVAANRAVARNPQIRFMLSLNDCDADEREIDQIPAARTTLRALGRHLSAQAFWRFELDHQALILVACGVGERVGSKLHVPSYLLRQPDAQKRQ
jgi:hypothetical protein